MGAACQKTQTTLLADPAFVQSDELSARQDDPPLTLPHFGNNDPILTQFVGLNLETAKPEDVTAIRPTMKLAFAAYAYDLLGITDTECPATRVKMAYHQKLVEHEHLPAKDENMLTLVNTAYDILVNPTVRRLYNKELHAVEVLRMGIDVGLGSMPTSRSPPKDFPYTLWIDPTLNCFLWQSSALGPELKLGYGALEIYRIQALLPSEEPPRITFRYSDSVGEQGLCVRFSFATLRDEVLEGIAAMRSRQSPDFVMPRPEDEYKS